MPRHLVSWAWFCFRPFILPFDSSNCELNARQMQMPVRRPADCASIIGHHSQTMRVGEREILIAELCEHPAGLPQALGVERLDRQRGQRIEKREELRCAIAVVPS